MSKETGGSAFPNKSSVCGGSSLESNGMTLRDYFAAKAMQTLIEINYYRIPTNLSSESAMVISFDAYQMADAMLKVR